jgi:hypothetical protein
MQKDYRGRRGKRILARNRLSELSKMAQIFKGFRAIQEKRLGKNSTDSFPQ